MNHLGAQRSESLENEIRVLIFGGRQLKRLEEFKRGALRDRDIYDQVTIAVFADAKIVRQEIGAHMANAFRPRQSFEPNRQSFSDTAEQEKWMGFAQGQKMGEARKLQRGPPAGVEGLGFFLEAEYRSQPSGSSGLHGKSSIADAVQPPGTGIINRELAGYALPSQPTGSENGIGRGGKKALVYPFAQWSSITGHKHNELNHTVLFLSNQTNQIGIIIHKINQAHKNVASVISPEHPRLDAPFPLLA
jgi:hypothetical protein